MGALIALARTVGTRLAGSRAVRFLSPIGLGVGGGAAGGLFDGDGGGAGGATMRRRRRRKALTNDDVRTALTIASAISKKAAENFILMRVRGQ